jgi:hypothetical protein
VVERCDNLRLTGEACHALRVGGERVWQDLDGHVPVELSISGAVDSTHATLTKFGGDSVVSDGESGGHAPALASYHLRNLSRGVELPPGRIIDKAETPIVGIKRG